jgi:hypothetical protein
VSIFIFFGLTKSVKTQSEELSFFIVRRVVSQIGPAIKEVDVMRRKNPVTIEVLFFIIKNPVIKVSYS